MDISKNNLNNRILLFPKSKRPKPFRATSDQLALKRDLTINKSRFTVKHSKKYHPTLPRINSATGRDISPYQDNIESEEDTQLHADEVGLLRPADKFNGYKDAMNSHSNVRIQEYKQALLGLKRFNTTLSAPDNRPDILDNYIASRQWEKGGRGGPNAIAPGLIVISREKSVKDGFDTSAIDSEMNIYSLQRSMTELPVHQSVEKVFGGHNSRLPHKLGSFEKIRDKQIYKRTRRTHKQERPLKQWPVGLELSGRCVTDDEDVTAEQDTIGRDGDESVMSTDTSNLPSLRLNLGIASPRSSIKTPYSASYYTDFGLRASRSDLFSGHKRNRHAKSASDSEMEKDLEKAAHRHIYACQVMSSVRKGSKAAHGLSSLLQTIGPSSRRSASSSAVEQMTSPGPKINRPVTNSPDKFFHDKKNSQIALFIKTRDSHDGPRMRVPKPNPLPEISGRTMLFGMSNK